MKRIVKILALLNAAALLAVSLCSCQYLDELKYNRAVYTNDNKTAFEFRGNTYRLLDVEEQSNVQFITRVDDYYHYECTVTTPDVPILLSKEYGSSMCCDDTANPVWITIQMPVEREVEKIDSTDAKGYHVTEEYIEKQYIRDDKYDEMVDIIENAKIDCYYSQIWEYSDEDEYACDYVRKLLPDDTIKAFDHTLKVKNKINYTKVPRSMAMFDIYPCDKNIVITNNDEYKLYYDNDDFYIIDLSDTRSGELYLVSDEDKEAFLTYYRQFNEDDIYFDDIKYYFVDDKFNDSDKYDYEGAGSVDNLL